MGQGAVFWVRLVMTGAGSVFALFGLVMILRTSWLYHRAGKAEGSVADILESVDDEGQTFYRSVIRFAAGEREWEIPDDMNTGWPLHKVGQRLPLYFPKGDPGRAAVWRPWWFAVLAGLILLGALLGVAASTVDWGPHGRGPAAVRGRRRP